MTVLIIVKIRALAREWRLCYNGLRGSIDRWFYHILAVFILITAESVESQTIPGPVLGGVSMLLYGLIASSGLRTLVEEGVDYKDKRNLTISSVVMVIGIGGGVLQFTVGSDFVFSLGGVALATVVGIVLN